MSTKDVSFDPRHASSKASARPGAGRSALDLKGIGLRAELAYGEAETPYFSRAHREEQTNPRRIPVARNMNESPLIRLVARGTLDERQALAGHHFRHLVEKIEGGLRSSSDIQERVDGGSRPDAFTEGRADASRRLKNAATLLGPAAYGIARAVCAEGLSLNELARRNRTRRETARDCLKGALDQLAESWGYGRARRDA